MTRREGSAICHVRAQGMELDVTESIRHVPTGTLVGRGRYRETAGYVSYILSLICVNSSFPRFTEE